MRLKKDMLVVVCETFNRMFNHNHDSLVSQALNCGLIKDLLNILGSSLANIPNASACKAQVVTCLKSMQKSLVYGDQVTALLSANQVWSQYESQKHDLFIEDKPGTLTNQMNASPELDQSDLSINFIVYSCWLPDLSAWHCWILDHVQVSDALSASSDREQ